MRCLLLILAVTTATAVELPTTHITVLPGGLIIERMGPVPAGDDALTGLPATMDVGSLSISVDGHEIDGWQVVWPEATPFVSPDPVAQQRLVAAERTAQIAKLRVELAAQANNEEKPTPGLFQQSMPALPGPEAIRAQIAFAAANAERAATDAQTAAEAADAARKSLALASPSIAKSPILRVPDLGGKVVRMRYFLPGANWAPSWRLEVDGGDATLVQLATIEILSRNTWPAVPLTVATRGWADAAVLADPSVPILGLNEVLEMERKPLVAGGSKQSENTVGDSLNDLSRLLHNGTGSNATDANIMLALLGAGHDHRTPNKYRKAMEACLTRLAALDPTRLDLPVLAQVTTVLAEAYAMSQDAELRKPAGAFLQNLQKRWPGEMPAWLGRREPLAGPQVAMLVVMAMKSCLAAGLMANSEDLEVLRDYSTSSLLGQGDQAEIAKYLIGIYTGRREPAITVEIARRWVASFDAWWSAAQVENIHMAMMVAFYTGGEAWTLINANLRERLIDLQIRSGPDAGLWPLDHHPLGKFYASTQITQSLEIYYRYKQITHDSPMPAALAAGFQHPWPIRLTTAQPVALGPGRQVVELRRARLASAITWESVPVQSPGVWRHLSAMNPWASPLPSGPVAVVADGRHLGNVILAATAPGAVIDLDLGPDDRLRVRRTLRSTTDDGLFKRTLAMTVTCRLEAPPGFTASVRIREPLPQPQGELIAIELLQPEKLSGENYVKRIAKDPLATATLSLAVPEALLSEMRLTYSRSVRPRLEAR